MFNTTGEFSSDLADIGLAAAADPQFAERLIEALRLLADPSETLSKTGAENIPDLRQGAVA